MKKILFLLCCLPVFAFGQRFEVGVSYGSSLYAISSSTYLGKWPLLPTQYSSMSLALVLKDYDATLRIGGGLLQYKLKDSIFKRAVVAASTNEITLALSTRINRKRLSLYGGISGGAVFFANPDIDFMAEAYPNALFVASRGSGFMAGIQVGANYAMSPRICFSAEASASYTTLTVSNKYLSYLSYPWFAMDMDYIKIPLTLGIKYKFGIGEKYRYKKKVDKRN